jgi:hypothetical protein
MIGYLTGKQIKELIAAGVTQAVYSTSTTYQHLGDLTSVYFFNEKNNEIAHQTMINDLVFYHRSWGGVIDRSGYSKSFRFQHLLNTQEDIVDTSVYLIV